MGKTKLITDYNYDFLVWGIISPWPVHRIEWLINDALDLKLHRIDDIEVASDTVSTSFFPLCEFDNEKDHYLLELIQNRIPSDIFIPELKTVDYILLVKGELDFFNVDEFINKIKSRKEGIHHIMEISMNKLKSKQNLIFR